MFYCLSWSHLFIIIKLAEMELQWKKFLSYAIIPFNLLFAIPDLATIGITNDCNFEETIIYVY